MSVSHADPAASPRSSLVGDPAQMRGRYARDRLMRLVVWVGGLGVIAALMLIFVYLLSQVFPLLGSAHIEPLGRYALPGQASETRFMAVEEQAEVALWISASGRAEFFDVADGRPLKTVQLELGASQIQLIHESANRPGELFAVLSDGRVLHLAHRYPVSYPDDRRVISPELVPIDSAQPLQIDERGVVHSAVVATDSQLLAAAALANGDLLLRNWTRKATLFGEPELQPTPAHQWSPAVHADQLVLDPTLNWLYVIDYGGRLAAYRLTREGQPRLVEVVKLGAEVRQASLLAGGVSLLLTHAAGRVSQWFPVRTDDGETIARVRNFSLNGESEPTALASEHRRRGFAVGTADGEVVLYYATSERRLLDDKLFDAPLHWLSFNPRAQLLLGVDRNGQMGSFVLHNEHPEVSWSALWGKVWYESYAQPDYTWQSSSASSDFEPKFSFMPLAVGTLKGAFYAMIFAVPIAILGAIFTANFMSSEMRQVVKPAVEVLAALPSVVLGFLAGLWLAPYVESNLTGMFLVLIMLPLSIPLFGYGWGRLPQHLRNRVPAGWEAAVLIPVMMAVIWFCFALAKPMETLLFGGNIQLWMESTLGIRYTQRNALVVGIAMGVAVIPIIFSIAEDAVFSVPKHLTLGSLALGATPWQTLVGVVLPTASPGIFSAVMIGMGRAVGETMIVLMATGNTPVMDFDVFTGMRTFAANIAVEMPESEVGSTHFRLLFLAGLVLFVFTFFFNTLAELVRSRLRRRYSNL